MDSQRPGVICSGAQKAGSHLLWKVVHLLGVPNAPEQYREVLNDKGEVIGKQRFDARWLRDGYSVHRHLPFEGKQVILARAKPIKFVVIIRDPRDMLISRVRSMARHKNRSTPQELAEKFLRPQEEGGRPIVDPRRTLGWVGWLTDPDACVVRFEDLRGRDPIPHLTKIRDYLQTNVKPEDILDQIEGGTGTWSGKNTVWREYWTGQIERQFKQMGGYEVVEALGYKI